MRLDGLTATLLQQKKESGNGPVVGYANQAPGGINPPLAPADVLSRGSIDSMAMTRSQPSRSCITP